MREVEARRTAEQINTDLAATYRQSQEKIQAEIDVFYARYMNRYGISLSEANKDLSFTQRENWLEGHLKRVEKLLTKAPGWQQLEQEHDAASFGARISRLQARQAEIDLYLAELSIEKQQKIGEGLSKIYKNGFYQTSFDIQSGKEVGTQVRYLDERSIKEVLDYPWSGANFSQRIWQNDAALKTELKRTLTEGIARGESSDVMAKRIKERFDVSFSAAKRLVVTESANIHAQATLEGYRQNGIEEYQLIATLDKRTSTVCQELDGQIFRVREAQTGVNYPPLHPWCRTTTKAVIEGDQNTGRTARNTEGKSTNIRKDISYSQWYNEYVEQIELPAPSFRPEDILIAPAQLGKKYRSHVRDFGLDPSIEADRTTVLNTIVSIIQNHTEIRYNTWRGLGDMLPSGKGRKSDFAYFYVYNDDAVVVNIKGEFVTVLKDGMIDNKRVKSAKIVYRKEK